MKPQSSSVLLFWAFLCVTGASAKRTQTSPKPCKELLLFFRDILFNGNNANNATSSIVVAPAGSNLTSLAPEFHFGNVVVFDDPVTLTGQPHAPVVGRAQGLYLYVSKSRFTSWLSFTLVLNSTHNKGTTSIMGHNPVGAFVDGVFVAEGERDVSVVGGTGNFFMHRGIATLRPDAFAMDANFQLRLDIKFYDCWKK